MVAVNKMIGVEKQHTKRRTELRGRLRSWEQRSEGPRRLSGHDVRARCERHDLSESLCLCRHLFCPLQHLVDEQAEVDEDTVSAIADFEVAEQNIRSECPDGFVDDVILGVCGRRGLPVRLSHVHRRAHSWPYH